MELPRVLILEKLAEFLKEPTSVTNIPLSSFRDLAYKGFVGKVHQRILNRAQSGLIREEHMVILTSETIQSILQSMPMIGGHLV